MMGPVARIDGRGANASHGRVRLAPAKAAWNLVMLAGAVVLGPITFSHDALLVFVVMTYGTLLFGHSVGMHRRLIHLSFDCDKWLERTLVYLGVIVGVAGPFGILSVHDHRDWAQRQAACHDYFAHRRHPLLDLFWQLACRFEFDKPPVFRLEPGLARDPWYRFLERTWMAQQLPVAAVLYASGGLSWVVWGVCVRVSVSAIGHWSVTYWCHNPGSGRFDVIGAGVQASNLPGFGWLTFGECWHNNHHAFPESARIGLETGQADPGWAVIRAFARAGWVSRIGRPRPLPEREDLRRRSVAAHRRAGVDPGVETADGA